MKIITARRLVSPMDETCDTNNNARVQRHFSPRGDADSHDVKSRFAPFTRARVPSALDVRQYCIATVTVRWVPRVTGRRRALPPRPIVAPPPPPPRPVAFFPPATNYRCFHTGPPLLSPRRHVII